MLEVINEFHKAAGYKSWVNIFTAKTNYPKRTFLKILQKHKKIKMLKNNYNKRDKICIH